MRILALLVLAVIFLAVLLRAIALGAARLDMWRAFLRDVHAASTGDPDTPADAGARQDAPLLAKIWLPVLFVLGFVAYLLLLPRILQARQYASVFLFGFVAALLLLVGTQSLLRGMQNGARRFALLLAAALLLEGIAAFMCVWMLDGDAFHSAFTLKKLGGAVFCLLFFLADACQTQQSFLDWRYPVAADDTPEAAPADVPDHASAD